MCNVANVRETQRTLLQKEEYSLFEAIYISFGRYLDIVIIDRSLRNFDGEEIRSKRDGTTKSTIPRPKRLFGL